MISASSEGCRRASLLSVTERWTCVGLASRIGATESQAIIERGIDAIDARSEALPERLEPEAAQQPGDADVGGDHAQPVAGARDLDVVDAHDLAAVDVDDLLVEQVGDQEQRARPRGAPAPWGSSSGRRSCRRGRSSATVSIGAKRRPCEVLMTRPSMRGKTSSGLLTRKSVTLPIGISLTVALRPTSSEMNPSVNAITHPNRDRALAPRILGSSPAALDIALGRRSLFYLTWRLSTFRGSGMCIAWTPHLARYPHP